MLLLERFPSILTLTKYGPFKRMWTIDCCNSTLDSTSFYLLLGQDLTFGHAFMQSPVIYFLDGLYNHEVELAVNPSNSHSASSSTPHFSSAYPPFQSRHPPACWTSLSNLSRGAHQVALSCLCVRKKSTDAGEEPTPTPQVQTPMDLHGILQRIYVIPSREFPLEFPSGTY